MHHRTFASNNPSWLLALFLLACGGRYVDTSGSAETGASAGSGAATGGDATGGNGGSRTGGSGGSGGAGNAGRDPGTNPGTSGGSGGSTGGTGGSSGGAGGATAGTSGSGGATGGAGGATGGTGGSTGGSGGATGGTGGFTGGSGGATGGTGGSGGVTGGTGGSTGNPCSTGGSGGVLEGQLERPSAARGTAGSAGDGAGILESGAPTSVDVGSTACYCTRRPGPGVSLRCPPGIDESTAAIVGPAGGSVSLSARQGLAQLTVPPKALDKDVTVTITETSIPPPQEFTDWSPIYEVLPGCLTSSSLMKLRLPWGNRDGLVSSGLTMYRAKDRNSPFIALPDVYINAGFSDAGITEFGLFFMGALKSPDQAACP